MSATFHPLPITAVAPGKLILSGEHAVVYGQPALACAVDLCCLATLAAGDAPGLHLHLPGLDRHFHYATDLLQSMPARLRTRHAEFLAGQREIHAVLDQPFELLAAAFAFTAEAAACALENVDLTLDIGPPLGCGMGSSAAAGLAIITAVRHASGLPLDPASLTEASIAIEALQHGTPSGVDSYVCAHGGAVRYAREQAAIPRELHARVFHLVHTGTPSTSTGQCVAHVAAQHATSACWSDFGDVTVELEAAILADDTAAVCRAVRRNHRLLCALGVVPQPVQNFIASLELAGLAGKICGAGAVAGAGGGMVWVAGGEPPEHLCHTYGFQRLDSKADSHGTRIMPHLSTR